MCVFDFVTEMSHLLNCVFCDLMHFIFLWYICRVSLLETIFEILPKFRLESLYRIDIDKIFLKTPPAIASGESMSVFYVN